MSDHCYACGVSLHLPDFRGPSDLYCKYCADEKGKLKSREAVQHGIAHWLKSWSPGLDDQNAMHRAALYMQAMPAWAESI